MATVPQTLLGDHTVLNGISWETYLRMMRAFDAEHRHLRITYDRGVMEIMTLSSEHERPKHLIRRLIDALTEELDINIAGYGSLTQKKRKKRRGLESDECFWIQNESKVRAEDADPRRLRPDLALEVDVSRSVLNRLSVYASLKVPEIWRWRKGNLEVYLLGRDGKYRRGERSRAFPFLRPAELARFVKLAATLGETGMLRAFRHWVREQQAAGWPTT